MKDDMFARICGAMYGVAVGDALGAPLEFMDAPSIEKKHGTVREMIGGGWLNVKPGEVTDDTQMTLCVARGIVESPEAPVEAVGRQFILWQESRPRDIGGIIRSSITIANILGGRNPSEDDWQIAAHKTHIQHNGLSAGNGSLMRTAYVGLYYPDLWDVISFADDLSTMTHYDPIAAEACAAYSVTIYRMINEGEFQKRRERLHPAIQYVANSKYDFVLDKHYSPNPSGYVVDSLAAALHCIYTTETFEDAVVKAVNLGGDADTIGAITGGLAGAMYGFEAIPERWVACLSPDVSAEIGRLSDDAATNRKSANLWQ